MIIFQRHIRPDTNSKNIFYTALISKEIRNIEEAAQYLLKARDFAEKANDYNLAFKISHDLCDIYSKQGLFDYKLTEAWRGYNYAQISKDSLSIYYALADLGHAYSTKEQIDSALYFSKRHSLLLKSTSQSHLFCFKRYMLCIYK